MSGSVPVMRFHDDDYEPSSVWPLLEAFESMKWGYAWAGYADDQGTDIIHRFFKNFLKRYQSDEKLVRSVYEAAA